MYCPNCGKLLPDGAKFCNACGVAQIPPAPAPGPAAQPPSAAPRPAPQPQKKSRAGLIIAAAVVIAAVILGRFVLAPSMRQSSALAENAAAQAHSSSGTSPDDSWSRTAAGARRRTSSGESSGSADREAPSGQEVSGDTGRETNDAYYQALAILGYQTPNSFPAMESGLTDPVLEFFVRDNGDGSIECHDYAAEGGTVVKYYETLLLDLTGMPAEQKEQIIGSLTEGLPVLNALDFVTAEYREQADGSLGILSVRCTGLDREENRRTLCDMGIFGDTGPYSLSALKQAELADGFISLFK